MALPTGQWSLKANGIEGSLSIDSVDAQGHVNGSAGNQGLEGYWDDQTHKLVFTSMNPSDASTTRIFSGYLHVYGIIDVIRYRLVGSVETITTSESSVERTVDGWIAEMGGGIVH